MASQKFSRSMEKLTVPMKQLLVILVALPLAGCFGLSTGSAPRFANFYISMQYASALSWI